MADIFISYSREDREWVESLAAQLQSEGFSVWWDWDLLVGKRYRESIDHELQSCRVAVVVWSQHSILSDFVRDEAEEAQQRNILVPVLKEMVRPPAGFRQIQTADLSTWTGGATHVEFRRVMKALPTWSAGRPSAESRSNKRSPQRELQTCHRVRRPPTSCQRFNRRHPVRYNSFPDSHRQLTGFGATWLSLRSPLLARC